MSNKKIYIDLTKHCIEQIIKRNKRNKSGTRIRTEKSAIMFGLHAFSKMILKGEYHGKKVKRWYSRDGKYVITNWKHKFIFVQVGKIEYRVISYINLENNFLSKTIKEIVKK